MIPDPLPPPKPDHASLELFRDDPLNRWLSHQWFRYDTAGGCFGRVVAAVAITWVPMLVLAKSVGVFSNYSAQESFRLDIAAHVQFLLGIPSFIIAEFILDQQLRAGANQFRERGVVVGEQLACLNEAMTKASRLANHWVPVIMTFILGAVFSSIWILGETSNGISSWHGLVTNGAERLTWAGAWDGFLAGPIVQFLQYRWAWKFLVWVLFLRDVSKLKLQLSAAHLDSAGGIGFVGQIQGQFGILLFTEGAVVAATVGYKLLVEKAAVDGFFVWSPLVAFAVLAPLFFMCPLLFFFPALVAVKREGVDFYAKLQSSFLRYFEKKWSGHTVEIGSEIENDASALSNLGQAYAAATSMRLVPFDFDSLRRLFLSAVAPMLPLIPRFLPAENPMRQWLEVLFK